MSHNVHKQGVGGLRDEEKHEPRKRGEGKQEKDAPAQGLELPVRRNRMGQIKPCSIAKKRLTRKEMTVGKELLPYMDYHRPSRRNDCRDATRPCPFVGCRYHLYLDVNPLTGNLKLNFPGMEVWQMPFSCALDVAEMGGRTLEEVGQILNMTRERVRQLEASALLVIRGHIEEHPRLLEHQGNVVEGTEETDEWDEVQEQLDKPDP